MRRARTQWMLGLVGAVLCVLVVRAAPLDNLALTLENARLELVALSILIAVGVTTIRMLRVAVLLDHRPRKLALLGGMAVVRVAGSLIPSDVALYWTLRKSGEVASLREFSRPWIVLRIYDTALLMIILAVATLLWPATASVKWSWLALPVAAAAAALVAAGAYGWATGKHPWPFNRLRQMAGSFMKSKPFSSCSLLLAVGYWGALVLSTSFALMAFSHHGLISAISPAMIAVCITALPIQPPLALGTAEAAWVFALTTTGTSLEDAAVIAIGIRLVVVATLLVHCGGAPVAFGISAWLDREARWRRRGEPRERQPLRESSLPLPSRGPGDAN